MKILQWMQNSLNGSNGKKKPNSASTTYYMLHEPCKQEFSDWPHEALLVIGTLGNNNLKEHSDHHSSNTSTAQDSSQENCVPEFTLDAAGNDDHNNELDIYLREQLVLESEEVITEQRQDTIDQQSSLQVGEKENETTFSDGDNISKGGNFYPNTSLIHCLDKRKSVNKRKSLVFLLKKMFVCRSGFPPSSPSFRDLLSTQSTMEKILRARLHRKLYPQGSGSVSDISKKKCLENKHEPKSNNGEEDLTSDSDDGSKWDNTDSESDIVLEI